LYRQAAAVVPQRVKVYFSRFPKFVQYTGSLFLSQTVKSLLLLGSAYKEKVLHSFYGLREFCFFKLGRKYNFVSIFVTRPIVKV
jgi:hypothetical protein